jgi:hypothetical protein
VNRGQMRMAARTVQLASITAAVISTGKTCPATLVSYDKTGDAALI